jgi:hypothetical protein
MPRIKNNRHRPCKNCSRHRVLRSRGLCTTCYRQPAVRDRFPADERFANRHDPEPKTLADVDRIIAEQRANLPGWWPKAEEQMREYERAGTPILRRP